MGPGFRRDDSGFCDDVLEQPQQVKSLLRISTVVPALRRAAPVGSPEFINCVFRFNGAPRMIEVDRGVMR
jgi:hypothetical protein